MLPSDATAEAGSGADGSRRSSPSRFEICACGGTVISSLHSGGTTVMKNRSRREFIGLTSAGVAGALGAQGIGIGTPSAAAQGAEPRDADLIVVNAKIYTMDAAI